MKIVKKKIDDLIGAEYNPRLLTEKQYSDLKDSLKRFGQVDPVLVNVNPERENIIIGGHQRTRVWKDLGNDTIDCVELDLTLDQEKELNVRLNKNTGQFDMDALANYFEQDELIDWGFESFEFGMNNEDVNLDDFFEEVEEGKDTEQKNKIILEYTEEDFNKVQDALKEIGGTKEQAIFNLLGL
jgi:hypothetical protein